jgi:hypothetical protein
MSLVEYLRIEESDRIFSLAYTALVFSMHPAASCAAVDAAGVRFPLRVKCSGLLQIFLPSRAFLRRM